MPQRSDRLITSGAQNDMQSTPDGHQPYLWMLDRFDGSSVEHLGEVREWEVISIRLCVLQMGHGGGAYPCHCCSNVALHEVGETERRRASPGRFSLVMSQIIIFCHTPTTRTLSWRILLSVV